MHCHRNSVIQRRLFALALDRLGDREPINELLEITLDERRGVYVERCYFPATSTNKRLSRRPRRNSKHPRTG